MVSSCLYSFARAILLDIYPVFRTKLVGQFSVLGTVHIIVNNIIIIIIIISTLFPFFLVMEEEGKVFHELVVVI